MSEPTFAPLVLTADPLLSADLVRLAAAAGATTEVVSELDVALRSWALAPLVLLGEDLVDDLAAARPARRADVYVVARTAPPDGLFRTALDCGADAVLTLSESADRIVDLLADSAGGASGSGLLVAVVGGAGGVGATTFAAALAEVCARRDGGALLVDADRLGAGADRVLGIDRVEGARWDALARPVGRLGARALRDALPGRDGLSVLTWPLDRGFALPAAAVRDVLSPALRAFPVVVADLPRHQDHVAAEILARCDRILVVSTLTLTAVSAAARVVPTLPTRVTGLVLRGQETNAVAETGRILSLPVMSVMRDQRRLDESVGLGLGPLRSRRGPLGLAAGRVADELLDGDRR